jgi:hypothetical protein
VKAVEERKMFMAEWRAHIQGEQFDLQELRESLAGHDPNIIVDGPNFYVTSTEWNQLEAAEVLQRAKELIQRLEDVAHLYSADTTPLKIGGLVRIDEEGRKHHILIAEAGAYAISGSRARAIATVSGAKATVEVKQEHQIIRHLRLSRERPDVRDALTFFRQGDWFNLYKAYELVGDDVGGKTGIASKKFISADDLRRFTGTAQSREQLGDSARHASKQYNGAEPPMSPQEARDTIRTLLRKWIDSL